MAKKRTNIAVLLKPLTFDQVISELGKAQKRKLEDCEPGATKSEIFEAFRIASKPTIKSKPDLKKPS